MATVMFQTHSRVKYTLNDQVIQKVYSKGIHNSRKPLVSPVKTLKERRLAINVTIKEWEISSG